MKNIALKSFVCLFLVAFSLSCIKNNIPYPVIKMLITEVKGEGFTMATPDNENRVITLNLDDTTDIQEVVISEVAMSAQATPSTSLVGEFDMRSPIEVTLSFYQDYNWIVKGVQNIERTFSVEGQYGKDSITYDASSSSGIARVNISNKLDLSKVNITELVLSGDPQASYNPLPELITDFSYGYRVVNVTNHGRLERWQLYVDTVEVTTIFSKLDVWSKVAWIEVMGDTSTDHGVKYRRKGDTQWIDVSSEDITTANGLFSTSIDGLEPLTEYEFQAYCGDDITPTSTMKSEGVATIENGDFENWSKSGKAFYPYSSGGMKFWDSGNSGSTTAGEQYNTTTQSSDIRPDSEGSSSAQLKSYNVLVKFAAGNIFTGAYVATKGTTGGIVGFGQPFTTRPRAIKGWVKYNQGIIDCLADVPPGLSLEKGSPDKGMIYAALGTWTKENYGISALEPDVVYGTDSQPLIVDTRDKGTFFKKDSEAVVAYGEKNFNESCDWQEFEIPLDYTTTSTSPTHIIIVASASAYGDYFTGSTQSIMWIDDLELVY